MSFWEKVVPGLLSSTSVSEDDDGTSARSLCPKEIGKWFEVDLVAAENIILALSIMSACLLAAFLLVCMFSIARESAPNSYSLKPSLASSAENSHL